MALHGRTLVVGASEDTELPSYAGYPSFSDPVGAIYVYELAADNSGAELAAKFSSDAPQNGEQLPYALTMGPDLILASSISQYEAFLFRTCTAAPRTTESFKAPDSGVFVAGGLGSSLAVWATTLVAGAPTTASNAGAAHVFCCWPPAAADLRDDADGGRRGGQPPFRRGAGHG